jgi:hypothetical protein
MRTRQLPRRHSLFTTLSGRNLGRMMTLTNIEAAARALCERQLRAMATVPEDASPLVDRYWRCLAAELEAGLIDTSGVRVVPFDFHSSQEAYRDWCQRHR